MIEQAIEQSRLRDALSEVTRKERRFLLSMSLLGIAQIKAGIIPSKIPGLGIELQVNDQSALLGLVSFVILYFLVAFIIYAISDYLAWFLAISMGNIEKGVSSYEKDLLGNSYPQPGTLEGELEKYREALHKKYRIYFNIVTPTSIVRALFDFVLPIIVGVYALWIMGTA